jgi:hypothetical protein
LKKIYDNQDPDQDPSILLNLFKKYRNHTTLFPNTFPEYIQTNLLIQYFNATPTDFNGQAQLSIHA